MISRLSTRAPLPKPQTISIKDNSLYTTFMVYFMDYRPPNMFIQRTYSKLMKERGIFTTWLNLIINQRSHNQQQESLQPVSFICFTKVRKFWETIKLFLKLFFDWWFERIHSSLIVSPDYLVDPLHFIGRANSSVCQRLQSVLPDCFSKIRRTFQFVKSFFKKNREPRFYDRSQPILSCERGNRTPDLKVMSLASYRCYYLAIYLYDYKPTSPRSPIHVMRWLYQRV